MDKTAHTWVPPKELTPKIVTGKIHQRYKDRLVKAQANNNINILTLAEDYEN